MLLQKLLPLRACKRRDVVIVVVMLLLLLEFSGVLLDLLLAKSVDDFGCWGDTLVDEVTFDDVSVWFILEDRSVEDCLQLQTFHG